MNNNDSLNFFKKLSAENPDIKSVKLAKNTDNTDIDAKFILNYVNKESEILDLGSGTGLIVNKIYQNVKSIDCVDAYEQFTKFIVKSPNVRVYNMLFDDFKPNKVYDLITIFGTMHYFNEAEAIEIYKRYFRFLKQGGKLIIKNQFGVSDDVTVDGFSAEQQKYYYAQYRHIDKEISILNKIGYKAMNVFDIYPSEANRWPNTHFYAIVANK